MTAIGRFSALPDSLLVTILWLLPTRTAARTSVLSRRFRYLWMNAPSAALISRDMPHPQEDNFYAMVDRVLLGRDGDAHPLLRLHLEISEVAHCESFVSCLFVKIGTFGLRHLTVEGWIGRCLSSHIFSMKSLESLLLGTITSYLPFHNVFPSDVGLTRLRTLSLGLDHVNPPHFHQVISKLCSLEDLSVTVSTMTRLTIASDTIRTLNLVLVASRPVLDIAMLYLPSLEVLHLENYGDGSPHPLPRFEGEIPLLRKAVLSLSCICKEDCGRLAELMNYVSHAQELILDVKEDEREKDPCLFLLDSGKEVPNFPNLKHLEVTMCISDHNLRAVVSMIRNSPALEFVKLVHELPWIRRTMIDWENRLSHNTDSNHSCCTFRDLHLGANRSNLLKDLTKRCDPKNQA